MAFDDELNNFMAAIRNEESGGNYSIHPNRAGASGAYQFIDSTWGGYGGYAHAYEAPPEVQDAKARELMTSYYNSFGNRWDLVAAAWNGGPGTAQKAMTDPGYLSKIGDGNMTVQHYVDSVMGQFDGGAGATTGSASGAPADTTTTPAAPAPKPPSLAADLFGAVGLVSGQSPAQNPGLQVTSTAGDTLGQRLQQISSIINGAAPHG